MSLRDFLTNVSVILGVMAAAALIETVVPMFMAKPWRHPRRTANLGLTALSFVSNWVLASVAALAAVWLRPTGLLAGLGWPMWIQVLGGIVVLDFSVGYLSHRTMHMWSPMWRFHQIHHSDDFVDTLAIEARAACRQRSLEIFAAREGLRLVIEPHPGGDEPAPPIGRVAADICPLANLPSR